MTIFFTVLHVTVCLILIVVVLLQRGKGAEIGAVFGGGASSTVFGARGAGNFLSRLTSGAAVVFMITSLTLAYFASDSSESTLFEGEAPVEQPVSPFEEAGTAPPAEEPAPSPFEEVTPGEPTAAPEAAAPGAAAPGPEAPAGP